MTEEKSKEDKDAENHTSQTITATSALALSPQDKALLKFGEDVFVNSAETIKDFAKTMITLITGLFAVYFAILEFLGIENVENEKIQSLTDLVSWPPILFIVSVLAFVFAIVPLSGKMSLNDPESIKKIRNRSLWYKIIAIAIGVSLFIIGMCIMLVVNLLLLNL